jgi:hypothetical protein
MTTQALPTETAAPAYIALDDYKGRWTVCKRTPRAASFQAREIAELVGREGVIWESFGHPFPGTEGFGRSRYVADSTGALHIYNSEGGKVLVHPADRWIRVLTTGA